MDKLPVIVLSLSILVLMYFINKLIKAIKLLSNIVYNQGLELRFLKAKTAQLESKLNIAQVSNESSKEKPPRA